MLSEQITRQTILYLFFFFRSKETGFWIFIVPAGPTEDNKIILRVSNGEGPILCVHVI